jgi:N-acetylmuramoyl-L-alanine amidase
MRWVAFRPLKIVLAAVAVFLGLTLDSEAKSSKKKRGAAKKTKLVKPTAAATAPQAPKAALPFSVVVIDAGHGGHDPGGIPQNIIPEKGVALDVALRLEKRLQAAGVRTVMTRSDDTFISLGERVRISDSEADAVFLSVHFNSGLREAARGIETYYGSPGSAPLAQLINRNLLTVTENPEYRGVKSANFWVLRKTKHRAVLVECGFLTNPEDACVALDEGHREVLATQIAAAVVEYRNSLAGDAAVSAAAVTSPPDAAR